MDHDEMYITSGIHFQCVGQETIFEGRPLFGIIELLAYGLPFTIIGCYSLVFVEDLQIFSLFGIFMIFITGFGILLIILCIPRLEKRLIVIDDFGIRFVRGNKVRWKIPKDEILDVSWDSLGANRLPRIGIVIRTARGTRSINNRDDFGPLKVLEAAYDEINRFVERE